MTRARGADLAPPDQGNDQMDRVEEIVGPFRARVLDAYLGRIAALLAGSTLRSDGSASRDSTPPKNAW